MKKTVTAFPYVRYALIGVTDQNVEAFAREVRKKTKRRVVMYSWNDGPRWSIYSAPERGTIELQRTHLKDIHQVTPAQWLRGEAPGAGQRRAGRATSRSGRCGQK